MRIFVAGSMAYDRIMNFPGKFADHILPDKIHILSVSLVVDNLRQMYGGTGGNIAYGLKLLGEDPIILATGGSDFGDYAGRLDELGLSREGIRIIEEECTGGCFITTDEENNQFTWFNPGAMKHPSQYEMNGVDPSEDICIIGPTNTEDMVAYPRLCRERSMRYIFDPGQQIPALGGEGLRDAIDGAWMLVSNDYELEMIQKDTGWSFEDMLDKVDYLITTLGNKGSRICSRDTQIEVPIVNVDKVLDPTGAGDAYRAGLIKGIAMGASLEEAARMGTTSASFCVEKHGTQGHNFTMAEFWNRHRAGYAGCKA